MCNHGNTTHLSELRESHFYFFYFISFCAQIQDGRHRHLVKYIFLLLLLTENDVYSLIPLFEVYFARETHS